MGEFGLYPGKHAIIPFESHLNGLEEQSKTSLLNLRDFVKSLGSNVIEEVRPHRISYAKTLTFRTFLEIQPRSDSLIIAIRQGRNEPVTNITISTVKEMESIKPQILKAYEKIK